MLFFLIVLMITRKNGGVKHYALLKKAQKRKRYCLVRLESPCKTKKDPKVFGCVLAGAEGIEPSSKVLETSVLPLNHAPTARIQASVIITPTKRGYKKEE